MSRVKRVTRSLMNLYLQIIGFFTKRILWIDFFSSIKQSVNDLSRVKVAILYKLKAICRIRHSPISRDQVKEVNVLNRVSIWCKPSYLTNWYEFKILYIGLSLLTLSAILLCGTMIGIKQDYWGTALRQERQIEKQEVPVNRAIEKSIAVVPEPVATVLPKIVQNDKKVNAPTIFNAITEPIKVDFGWQLHPIYKEWRYHAGIDLVGLENQAVHTICSGEVTNVIQDKNTGLTVVVKNNDYQIYYGSLSEVTISKGSHVERGQEIGKMGMFEAEPYYHVHLAIKKGEKSIDPKVVSDE